MSAGDTARAVPPGGATISADSPWPGLLAFRETDEGYFQGRQAETEELFRLVMRERLTVLFGLSGLGKSSLLQAGLFPRLRPEQIVPVYIRFDFSSERPDLVAQVRAAIAREAGIHRIEVPAANGDETLWEYFHRAGNNFWNARNRPVMPLLVFDQFEEIFTLGRLGQGRTQASDVLVDQIADLAEGRPPAPLKAWMDEHPEEAAAFSFGRHHYKILLGIREDFLPDLEALRARMPAVALNRLRLRRMNGDAALLVVNQAPHLVDADVALQIVRFVSADRRALPLAELEIEPALLSVVCRELNSKRLRLGAPCITAGLLEGSQEQVLSDFYERSTADLPPEARFFIEDHLLTVSGFRDSVALENALSMPGVSRSALDQLVERRLIRREDRGGVQRLELTHDLLTGVVRTSRDSRRQKDEVEREKAGQELERQREKTARDRRDLTRTRIAAGVILVLFIAAMGAAGWALLERREAEEARRQAQVAQQKAEEATVSTRQAQLNSADGAQVIAALYLLSSDSSVRQVVEKISGPTMTNEWIASVALALDKMPPEAGLDGWQRDVRAQLALGLSQARSIDPPPSREHDEAINARVPIAGGRFQMGSAESVQSEDDERPPHSVTLSPFRIQEHEVTNEEYRRFDPEHDRDPKSGTDATVASRNLPVVDVSWSDAMAYAFWIGGTLPTEAQWEFAARGTDGRTYPWGEEEPTCARAQYVGCPGRLQPVKAGRELGKTPDGVYDLAGNVWEWCRDWRELYTDMARTDPLGPDTGRVRRIRGGSFSLAKDYLRGAHRQSATPTRSFDSGGFRVVWPD